MITKNLFVCCLSQKNWCSWSVTAIVLGMAIEENCDIFTSNCEFFTVTTHSCDIFIVTTRNCVAIFRNYGSQCDRSYGVTTPQFDRNRTHGTLTLWHFAKDIKSSSVKIFSLSSFHNRPILLRFKLFLNISHKI